MNKSAQAIVPDDDIGPLDADGVQIWSPEEEAAIARVTSNPEFLAGIAEAEADIAAGRCCSHEETIAHSIEMKRRWFAEKGITPPPGYFDR